MRIVFQDSVFRIYTFVLIVFLSIALPQTIEAKRNLNGEKDLCRVSVLPSFTYGVASAVYLHSAYDHAWVLQRRFQLELFRWQGFSLYSGFSQDLNYGGATVPLSEPDIITYDINFLRAIIQLGLFEFGLFSGHVCSNSINRYPGPPAWYRTYSSGINAGLKDLPFPVIKDSSLGIITVKGSVSIPTNPFGTEYFDYHKYFNALAEYRLSVFENLFPYIRLEIDGYKSELGGGSNWERGYSIRSGLNFDTGHYKLDPYIKGLYHPDAYDFQGPGGWHVTAGIDAEGKVTNNSFIVKDKQRESSNSLKSDLSKKRMFLSLVPKLTIMNLYGAFLGHEYCNHRVETSSGLLWSIGEHVSVWADFDIKHNSERLGEYEIGGLTPRYIQIGTFLGIGYEIFALRILPVRIGVGHRFVRYDNGYHPKTDKRFYKQVEGTIGSGGISVFPHTDLRYKWDIRGNYRYALFPEEKNNLAFNASAELQLFEFLKIRPFAAAGYSSVDDEFTPRYEFETGLYLQFPITIKISTAWRYHSQMNGAIGMDSAHMLLSFSAGKN